MADIRIATSPEDRLAVYHFRYSVYVEEMGLDESYADHDRKIISDALDGPKAMILAAWDGERVIGTTRSNLIRDGGIGDYLKYYRLSDLPSEILAESSISTRIMVHPDFRRTPLTVRLVCDIYRRVLAEGVQFDFCDCESSVAPFFAGLGYTVQFDDFDHPEFGLGSVMRLAMRDLDHLVQVRSPFRRILSSWMAERVKT